jgi:DNA-binding transcriptional ArsR family regulator
VAPSLKENSTDERVNGERQLRPNDVHNVLRNERRAEALRELRDGPGESTLRELSEIIAAVETGESPPPRGARDSVYASLHQTHLPMLERLGIVEYQKQGKVVRLATRAGDLNPYLNVTTAKGRSWQLQYIVLGVSGILVTAFAAEELPLFGALPASAWAVAFLLGFGVAILGQYGPAELERRLKKRIRWSRKKRRTRSRDGRNGTPVED